MSVSHPTGPPGSPGPLDLLRDEYDNMLACIRCGQCLPACPTYQVTHLEEESPRGRIAMARALVEGHLTITPDLVQHQVSCLLCEACTSVCPAGVRMEHIGIPLRQVLQDGAPSRRHARLARAAGFTLFRHMRLFRTLAALLRFYQRSGLQVIARALRLPRLLGMEREEGLLPRISGSFLVPNGQVWHPPVGEPREHILLFAGCVMSTAYADVDRATARVLAAHGCQVTAVPGQGCCGALNAHAGDLAGAHALARNTIQAFEQQHGSVAVNAAGCGAMLKEYGHLLAHDPAFADRARAFAARVRDVSEILDPLEPLLPPRALPLRVAYQDACHLAQAQRITRQPRRLLQRIPGLQVVDIPDASLCCGSAGIYNLTQPDMADALQARKVNAILTTDAEVVVSANPGCLLQIADGLRRAGRPLPTRHLMEVLDDALGPLPEPPEGEALRPRADSDSARGRMGGEVRQISAHVPGAHAH